MSEKNSEDNSCWYLVAPGSDVPSGPFSIRDLDVKFRTGEIVSSFNAWREGLSEW